MVILPMFFILLMRTVIPMKIGIPLKKRSVYLPLSGANGIPAYAGMTLIGAWIIIAAYSTFIGGFRFKNDYTLFQPAVKQDDNFLEGHQYLGDYYFYRNELKPASAHYERALKKEKNIIAFVDTPSVLNNLAGVRMMQNRFTEADAILVSLQKLQGGKGNLSVRYNRALIAYKQKKYQKVVDLLYDSYKKWNRPEPIILLGDSLKKLGKEKEAKVVLKLLQ
jgi:tetratricopeptide (TPR) repeat protein